MKKYKPSKEFALSAALLIGSFFVFQGLILPSITYGPENTAAVSRADSKSTLEKTSFRPVSMIDGTASKEATRGTSKSGGVPCNNIPGDYICNGNFELEQITDPNDYYEAFLCYDSLPPYALGYFPNGNVPFWCGDSYYNALATSTLLPWSIPIMIQLPLDCSIEQIIWLIPGATFPGCTLNTPDGSQNAALIYNVYDEINYPSPFYGTIGSLATKLEQPLVAGQQYKLEFDVRVLSYGNELPDELKIITKVGSDVENMAFSGWLGSLFPQTISNETIPYNTTDNSWIHIEENFISNGNYDALHIGNEAALGLNPNHRSYFYIDNVSIREVGTDVDIQVSNTLTDSTLTATDRHVTFKVEIANAGPATASNIVVHNQIPTSFAYYSHTTPSPNTYNNTSGNLSIPTLLPGQTTLVEIVMNVPTSACGLKTDIANLVSLDQPVESDPANNQASASIQMPKACEDRVKATY